MNKRFSWLHISDLHVGQMGDHLWSNFRAQFFNDVRYHVEKYGRIDLVIFSGDLTQTATPSEFEQLKKELVKLWGLFDSLGCKPYLFCVPGNHDLSRPPGKNAQVKMLNQWSTDQDVLPELLSGSENQYSQVITASFANYVAWLADPGVPMLSVQSGLFPGDASAVLIVDDIKIGLIGLNSAFLQLTGGDYLGRLFVSPRQLDAVTDGDATIWCENNQFNFLITHHPPTWLENRARVNFMKEIHRPNRFVAHLFGHMHEAGNERKSSNGSPERREVQSSSLFGMEHWDESGKNVDRVHGFSFNELKISHTGTEWKTWPRLRMEGHENDYIAPDHVHFELVRDTEYYITEIKGIRLPKPPEDLGAPSAAQAPSGLSVPTVPPLPQVDMATLDTNAGGRAALAKNKFQIPPSENHLAIRGDAQRFCAHAINAGQIVWLSADKGMGREGFIWSVAKTLGRESNPIYRIVLGEFQDRNEFLVRFDKEQKCTFADFCKALEEVGPSFLLLEEAPTTTVDIPGTHFESSVEGLMEIARSFLPETAMILLSRSPPKKSKIPSLRVGLLEEPETMVYLGAQSDQIRYDISAGFVSKVQRLTEGLIIRIDELIEEIKVSSIDDVQPPELSSASTETAIKAVSPSLIRIIDELESHQEAAHQRAYLLLQILSLLPHGESSRELKNVIPTTPIFSKSARILSKLNLVECKDVGVLLGAQDETEEDQIKIFVQPQVRDYVLSRLSEKQITQLIEQLAEHYFGKTWLKDNPKPARIVQIVNQAISGVAGNPHSLILRMLGNESMKTRPAFAAGTLKVCVAYCYALRKMAQYRQVISLAPEMLSNISLDATRERTSIEIRMAQSVRMAGEETRALPMLDKLLNSELSNDDRRLVLINKALCLEAMRENEDAVALSRMIVKEYPKTSAAMQAKSIILDFENPEDKAWQLQKLENRSRKDGHLQVANTLALQRIASHTYPKAITKLREIYDSAKEDTTPYIYHQVATRIARFSFKLNGAVSTNDFKRSVAAYHYFYGERFDGLFTVSHRALWDCFESAGTIENLLELYRHSSFVWRLNGQESYEANYLKKLVARRDEIAALAKQDDKNVSYFWSRCTLLDAPKNTGGGMLST